MWFKFIKNIKKKRNLSLLLLLFMTGVFIGYSQKKSSNINEELTELSEYESSLDTVSKKKKDNIVPIPFPITDENLGYGGILAVAYMNDNKKSNRPNTPQTITGIAGGATSTGSWLASIFHSQAMNNDKMRYDGMVGYADMFLDYYLFEKIDRLRFPIETNITFWGTQHQMLFRFGQSNFFIGPQYRYMNVKGKINLELDDPDYEDLAVYLKFKETVSAIALLGNYDSRDQVISPVKGYYTGFFIRRNATWLGATKDYYWAEVFAYAYYKPGNKLYTILKFDFQYAGDNTPFYAKPYVSLRGVPAMRYQGNEVSTFENQWRVDLFKNVSLVAFAGVGKSYNSLQEFSESKWIHNYGTGIRYTLKNINNLRVGVDVAWSNENFAWGISLGTGL